MVAQVGHRATWAADSRFPYSYSKARSGRKDAWKTQFHVGKAWGWDSALFSRFMGGGARTGAGNALPRRSADTHPVTPSSC